MPINFLPFIIWITLPSILESASFLLCAYASSTYISSISPILNGFDASVISAMLPSASSMNVSRPIFSSPFTAIYFFVCTSRFLRFLPPLPIISDAITGLTFIRKAFELLSFASFLIFLSCSSLIVSSDFIKPFPLQHGQVLHKVPSMPSETFFLVISRRPSFENASASVFVLSLSRSCLNLENTLCLSSSLLISMKSITIMPPISLNLNWLVITSAASRLVLSIVWDELLPLVNLPVFTSMEVRASPWSITIKPPDLSQTFLSRALSITVFTLNSSKSSLSP